MTVASSLQHWLFVKIWKNKDNSKECFGRENTAGCKVGKTTIRSDFLALWDPVCICLLCEILALFNMYIWHLDLK